MIIYEPIDYFRISEDELQKLCREVIKAWPDKITFSGKVFGSKEEYKCESFTVAYRSASDISESMEFGEWGDLAPIVFDFIARAIKDASVYLEELDLSKIDMMTIVKDMRAREDIRIEA